MRPRRVSSGILSAGSPWIAAAERMLLMADDPRSSGAILALLLAGLSSPPVPTVDELWRQFSDVRRSEFGAILGWFSTAAKRWSEFFAALNIPAAATRLHSEVQKCEAILQKWLDGLDSPKPPEEFARRYVDLGDQAWKLGEPSPLLPDVTEDWVKASVADYATAVMKDGPTATLLEKMVETAIQGRNGVGDVDEFVRAGKLWPGKFNGYKQFQVYLKKTSIRRKNKGQRLYIHAKDWIEHWYDKDQARFEVMDAIAEVGADGLLGAERERLVALKQKKQKRP
jgi:hypothetical protein